jgi:hypothetical protein
MDAVRSAEPLWKNQGCSVILGLISREEGSDVFVLIRCKPDARRARSIDDPRHGRNRATRNQFSQLDAAAAAAP